MSTPWAAPTASGPVHATVPVAGSKSVTNRALLLAALADGPSTLRSPLRSRDTSLMVAALRALGVGVVDAPRGGWRVHPPSDGLAGGVRVDCGLAGTVMRFVPPAAALARGTVWFDGDPRARQRPMGVMLSALRSLGISVAGDALPFAVHGVGRVAGGAVTLDASASSQFVSGLLLSGARFDRGVEVRHVGSRVPSLPHIEMTLDMLAARGVSVSVAEPATWRVDAGPIRAVDCDVEPDLSNAAVYLAAAAVTGGRVTVPAWPAPTTQAGDAIRGILAAMGCSVVLAEDGLSVQGPPRGSLTGLDIDLHDVGELTPTVAALAALASGPSQLRGVGHLRGHETDRLAALAGDLNRLGGCVAVTSDGLRVQPRPLHGGLWRSCADHRMATAGALVGLVVRGVEVDDIGCTSKTIPNFPAVWASLLDGVPAE